MSMHPELCRFIELFHRALMAQMHYVQDHPEVVRHMESFQTCLLELLELETPLLLTQEGERLLYGGEPLEGSPYAAQILAQNLEARRIGGIAFQGGVDADDLQLLFFALLMPPQRLLDEGAVELGSGSAADGPIAKRCRTTAKQGNRP